MAADAPQSVREAAEWLRKRFEPEAARDVRAAYLLALTGPAGGHIALRVEDGALELQAEDAVEAGPAAAGSAGARAAGVAGAAGGEADAVAPPDAAPVVTIRLAAQDLYGVLSGRENTELLFVAGRIAIEGDPTQALRLRTFFRRRA